jgi:metal-responsive CopG/Arc/MetJ family transcriptional regulator
MSDQSSFRLPRALTQALARVARERGIPKSEVVREALQAYLIDRAADPDAAWHRVAPMVGSVQLDAAEIERDALARQVKAHNWRP